MTIFRHLLQNNDNLSHYLTGIFSLGTWLHLGSRINLQCFTAISFNLPRED